MIRSCMRARSNSAIEPRTPATRLPAAVLVSMPSPSVTRFRAEATINRRPSPPVRAWRDHCTFNDRRSRCRPTGRTHGREHVELEAHEVS